ncbi:MAG: hypothetical protein ACREN7_00050 [Candidatus Dormibacteria bacterium]
MTEIREIRPEEWAAIGELAAAAPDLAAVKDRLVAALGAPGTPAGAQPRPGAPGLQPTSWKDLLVAVRLGVLTPAQARRFAAVPEARPGIWRQFWLRTQRGGRL